jgi:hypothetical protein
LIGLMDVARGRSTRGSNIVDTLDRYPEDRPHQWSESGRSRLVTRPPVSGQAVYRRLVLIDGVVSSLRSVDRLDT